MSAPDPPRAIENERHCPVCGENGAKKALKVKEDRFGEDWNGWVWACDQCGCFYLRHPPGQKEMDEFYKRCYSRYGELLSPDRLPKKWVLHRFSKIAELRARERQLDNLEGLQGPKVLDFGCHDGHLLPLMEARGWEAWGYDPTIHETALHPRLRTGRFEDLAQEIGLVDDILVSHVLEHLLDPEGTFRRLAGLLRPGGRIHIRIPNLNSPFRHMCGSRWIHWHPPFHFQHFHHGHIDRMAEQIGFRCISSASWTPVAWVASNFRNLFSPPKIFPDRRFHRELSVETFLLLFMVERAFRILFGGDAMELVYELRLDPKSLDPIL